ncbi:hypothetical protein L843_2670 [Mycobacterium intracellulare MIN_061107_1834]|nr:hypothetical protein L843_2670 [Mycobacterium intracellulare MIN_061107_1834]
MLVDGQTRRWGRAGRARGCTYPGVALMQLRQIHEPSPPSTLIGPASAL